MSDPTPADATPDPVDVFVSFVEGYADTLTAIGTRDARNAADTTMAVLTGINV